jgi:hypothetical protein
MSNVFLSAILIIDELPHLDHVPWQSAVSSTLAFADEMIVVHGGHTTPEGRKPTAEYFTQLANPRIKVVEYPWPDNFNWMQIGRSCAFGHLHARGEWCFRVLADEVFPHTFETIPKLLAAQPDCISVVSVMRHYMLGNHFAFPFHDKPLFFRNNGTLGYGTINPAQGPQAMPSLFDDPIDTDHWFDGTTVVDIRNESMTHAPDAIQRLLAGETPRGYRDLKAAGTLQLPLGMLNVDVNYLPDDLILAQKNLSLRAYERLPPGYWTRRLPQGREMLDTLLTKIDGMLNQRILRIHPPADLLDFIDKQDPVFNSIRDLCELRYALPWNRVRRRAPRSHQVWHSLKRLCRI